MTKDFYIVKTDRGYITSTFFEVTWFTPYRGQSKLYTKEQAEHMVEMMQSKNINAEMVKYEMVRRKVV